MKVIKIIYWISTGFLTALMLMSAGMYFFNHGQVSETFLNLGYPAYIIYPLGTAKILGLLAIWTRKSIVLKEWAYAGFFFNTLLGFSAHIMAKDGEFAGALFAIVLVLTSYFTSRKVFGK